MKTKIILITRVLLGLIFFIFGLNGLLLFTVGKGFIPMPPPAPEMATIFAGFMATNYLMILVKLLETVAGVLLLANRYVNLALVLLAPIVVNILGIHLFAERSGLPMGLAITVLLIVQIWSRWSDFKPLLKSK